VDNGKPIFVRVERIRLLRRARARDGVVTTGTENSRKNPRCHAQILRKRVYPLAHPAFSTFFKFEFTLFTRAAAVLTVVNIMNTIIRLAAGSLAEFIASETSTRRLKRLNGTGPAEYCRYSACPSRLSHGIRRSRRRTRMIET